MREITNPALIHTKGALFLLLALLSAGGLFAESPRASTLLLLLALAWSTARAYYYAFYVVERYVDPSYRFAGLMDFARYLVRRRRSS